MATTMVNGEGGNVSSSGRQQSKSAFNNKPADGNRKQGANSDPVRYELQVFFVPCSLRKLHCLCFFVISANFLEPRSHLHAPHLTAANRPRQGQFLFVEEHTYIFLLCLTLLYFPCETALDIGVLHYTISPSSLHMASRRNAPQKAWTTGMNPITQRSTTPAQQNGAGNQAKAVSQRPVNNRETNSPEKHAHDRLIFLLGNMIVSSPQASQALIALTIKGTSGLNHCQKRRYLHRNIFWDNTGRP